MDWKHSLNRAVGPGFLRGMLLPDLMRLLATNQFRVSPGRLPKLPASILLSTLQSALEPVERAFHQAGWESQRLVRPIFVIGMGRSGTSHLHHLLSQDPKFFCCREFDVSFPHTFLTTKKALSRLISPFVPSTRLQDGVKVGLDVPVEDEVAYLNLVGMSPFLGRVFPRNWQHYSRYRSFDQASEDELLKWKDSVFRFAQKLQYHYGGEQLLMKTPVHIARIRHLLSIFPDALFVHIRRHPRAVLRSKLHAVKLIDEHFNLQPVDPDSQIPRLVDDFSTHAETFLRERELLPAGRLHELTFEDLLDDRVGEIKKLYRTLSLDFSPQTQERLETYIAGLRHYQMNHHDALPPELLKLFKDRCRHWLDFYDYAI